MLKKFLLAIVAIIGFSVSAAASDTYAHDASVLPKAAQTTLKNNFKAKVSVVKIDKDLGHISEYEVVLTDGTEIEFDRSGNWKSVEVSASKSVPSAFVPNAITASIKKLQPGQKVIGIEKKRNGYNVDLSNGVEMKFDLQGKFIKYDD